MAQAKKKAATKTAAKTTAKKGARKCAKKSGLRYEKYDRKNAKSNMFFVVTMSVLAATLLFADLLMMNA